MTSPTHDPTCRICAQNTGAAPVVGGVLYRDDEWLVRHAPPPYGVAGWLTVQTQRHVREPADFNDREAAAFGPAFRHFARTLREVTGALRIYMAAMGESVPHFHAHLVPRYEVMPDGASAWAVFDLAQRAAKGEITVDPAAVTRIMADFQAALKASPETGRW